jgi:phosphoribosylaminoimidazolecarboxamide formyltransferase/IMP cyclohydrolase
MNQRTALISVYNKEGIIDFARELVALNFNILASGGTAKALGEAGIKVTDVASLVGGGAILGHRVVTLSREVHAGLLAKDNAEDRKELEDLKIPFIDLVCCDLYPLQDEVMNPNATRESVIEKTDIGGPTMLRSAAKGRRITICDFEDRNKVITWLKDGEPDREEFLNNLAAKTEFLMARYIATSAIYHSQGKLKSIFGEQILEAAYGENAYQKPAGLYDNAHGDKLGLPAWKQLEGSPLSYNNLCDVDRMLQTVTHIAAGFDKNFQSVPKIAIGVKHGNACGAGVAESGIEAIDKMLQGDLRAIFGGSIMLNFAVDEKVAEELINKFSPEGVRRLLDIIAAPSFTPEAIEILARKKGKCRLLANEEIGKAGMNSLDTDIRFRYVRGGFLLQPNYTFVPDIKNNDVILAWAVGSTSNSNTISLVKDGQLLGNGVGQQDRVGAAMLAIMRAGDKDLNGATAYSDSFFPFPDAPQVLIDKGIKTIFSTSGSVNDEKIKELCASRGVELILLPDSEARGFYQH